MTGFPDTVGTLLRRRSDEVPDRVFVRLPDQSLTFAALTDAANRVAHVLTDLGVGKGDVVASMLPTSLETLATWFGTAKAGIVQAPVNLGYQKELLARLLSDVETSVVVAGHDYWSRITEVADRLPALTHLLVEDQDVPAARAAAPGLNIVGYGEATRASSVAEPGVHVAPQDPSAIIFTSGTTGRSKAILRSHGADLAYARDAIRAMSYTADDVQYQAFPLFHGFARYNSILPMAMVTGTVVLLPRFSVSGFWDTCRREGVTTFNFLGATIQMLLNQPASERDRDHQVVKGHGAPVPAALLGRFRERFGVRLIETYGSSELGIITANTDNQPGSCGTPVDSYTVEIRDEEDEPVAIGGTGEIAVAARGPSAMFTGYVGRGADTEESLRGGWFHTGDVGRLDDAGRLYFVDRKKDVIRRRGENISSWEVELALITHPAVAEAAVFGVPSEFTEEDVAVAVVAKQSCPVSAEELIAHSEDVLPDFAVPRYILFLDELPKTPTGRVEKYRLRKRGVAGAWDRAARPLHG